MPWRYLVVVLAVSSPLHFAWEWIQCQPFFVHRTTPPTVLAMFAATLGDLALTLIAYAAVAVLHGRRWPLRRWRWRLVATLEGVALALAISVELYALSTGRWVYTDAAPRVPFTNVSAIPIMQLTLLLPASFLLARWLHPRSAGARWKR